MSLAGVPHRLLARGWRGSVPATAPAALAALVFGLLLVVLSVQAQPARAVILPAQTIAGPSEEIVGFGGVAMATDGTGGAVFLQRVGGVPHVFVSRYAGGQWQAPIRVDTEEPYAASWPRIGAAAGGELIVTWASQYALSPPPEGKPQYEMLGAELAPGGEGFGQAILVDKDIHEATGTDPELAVSSTGFADLVYRVVEQHREGVVELRRGDVTETVRVAHFDGLRWTNLGAINRNIGVGMRPPTAQNAPRIAIGSTGNGVVVWQEPELNGVARIWSRRLFGSTLDYVMPASASSYNGAPITQDADAPSVAVTWLGQADVAYRQSAGPGSPLPGPRVFLNVLPSGESTSGAEFTGASVADGEVPGGQSAAVGPPSIDVDEKEELRILYDSNGTPRVIEGNDHGLTGTLSLGPPFAGAETSAVSVMNPQGGGVSAWSSGNAQGASEVGVREDFSTGAAQTGLVGGGAGGEVAEVAVGRSGLGDGLVAWRQGPLGNAAIVASAVTAPPAELVLSVPKGLVEPGKAVVSWEPAVSADGPLRYTVVLDGRAQATPPGASELRLDPLGLSSGAHRVQLLATDIDGQSTLSKPSLMHVDGAAPIVSIARAKGGRGLSVRVHDPYTVIDVHAVKVSFGDGHSARGHKRFSHRYARGGVYRVVVHVRDKLGNTGVVSRWVKVR
jgi:PKD domain